MLASRRFPGFTPLAGMAAALVCVSCGPASPTQEPAAPTRAPDTSPEPEPPAGRQTLAHEQRLYSTCGSRCGYGEYASSTVELILNKDGSLSAASQGRSIESFRSIVGTREEQTRWRRTWQGSWQARRRSVRLKLDPVETSCGRDRGADRIDVVCPDLSLELTCRIRTVALVKGRPPTELSWVCSPRGPVPGSSHLTPFPWVFGTGRALLARDRGQEDRPERRYRLLDPSPPEHEKKHGRRKHHRH